MIVTMLAQLFCLSTHIMVKIRDDVLGDYTLGAVCELVPNAGVAAWPATSLAEAKPACTIHEAPRRSRWVVRFPCPQKRTREEQLVAAYRMETGNNAGFLLLGR